MFGNSFFIHNLIISIFIIFIFGLRKFLKNKVSLNFNYYIWFVVIFAMIFAFVPSLDFNFNNSTVQNYYEHKNNDNYTEDDFSDTVEDFYSTVYVDDFNIIFSGMWFFGFVVSLIFFIIKRAYLNKMFKQNFIYNKKIFQLFEKECEKIKINAKLYLSYNFEVPFSCGEFKNKVCLPYKFIENLTEQEITYIIRHELIHHKHKDSIINAFINLVLCIYWFNPFVRLAFKAFRLDMEFYCDYEVLNHSNGNFKEYGNVLINCACQKQKTFDFGVYAATGKKQLFKRMKHIVNFKHKKNFKKSNFVWGSLIFIVLIFNFLIMNVFGYELTSNYDKNIENCIYANFENFFENCEGCFVMYDSKSKNYLIYNEELARKRVSPNSTYKIAIGLNSLENNIITPDNNYLLWNGEKYPFKKWNSNQNLSSAMKSSVNWYFQNLEEELSYSQIYDFLDLTEYGNKNVFSDKTDYWLGNSLKISPLEQVEFLKNIYSNVYNFDEKNIKTIFNSIKISNGLYGKTGAGELKGELVDSWFVGVLEKDDNTYFFAVYMTGEKEVGGTKAFETTRKILKQTGII